MYAIVNIAGQQFKVEEGKYVFVHRLEANPGESVTFDQVMMVEMNNQVQLGTPILGSAKVKGTILSHDKGDKVIVFKKKRRKGYRVKKGHRQSFTKVQIDSITA